MVCPLARRIPLSASQLSVGVVLCCIVLIHTYTHTLPSFSNSPGGKAGPILLDGTGDGDEEDGGRAGPIHSVTGAVVFVPWCRSDDDDEEMKEGESSGPTTTRTSVAGPRGAVRIFGFFVLVIVVLLVVTAAVAVAEVDRETVAAAKDGGKVGPIVVVEDPVVLRGRFLWFWHDGVVVVVPTKSLLVIFKNKKKHERTKSNKLKQLLRNTSEFWIK